MSKVALIFKHTLIFFLLFIIGLPNFIAQDGELSPNGFAELFANKSDFDLEFTTLTFIPDGSTGLYTICQEVATGFQVDPTDDTPLVLPIDGSTEEPQTLTGGATFPFFGVSYSSFFVGSNGYITFNTGDDEFEESRETHFSMPRIAALFDDLNPTVGNGNISWDQMDDRVVVTFEEVSELFEEAEDLINSNSFQIELFFDGTIRITWLGVDADDGLVGLSRGEGVPSGFIAPNLSSSGLCTSVLKSQILLNKTMYTCGQLLEVEIRDPNASAETLSVTLFTASGDSESIQVEDTDGDQFYRGSIPIEAPDNPVEPGDTILQGSAEDTITVTYTDEDDGTGIPKEISETVRLDCQLPVISEIKVVDIEADRFTVTFVTDEPASAKVSAGVSCDNQPLLGTSPPGEAHSITFDVLSPCTTYWFTIEVTDKAGNTTTADNAGACFRAITLNKSILFSNAFEESTEGWSVTSSITDPRDIFIPKWHVVDKESSLSHFPEAHSGNKSWWYGFEATGNYAHSRGRVHSGKLRSPPISLLDVNGTPVSLSFYSWAETEGFDSGADTEEVVSGENTEKKVSGVDTMAVYVAIRDENCEEGCKEDCEEKCERLTLIHQVDVISGSWEKIGPLDLRQFSGQKIRLVFEFNTVDTRDNDFRGWYIDDVVIGEGLEEPCVSEFGTVQLFQETYSCGQLLEVEIRDLNAGEKSLVTTVLTGGSDSESLIVEDTDGDKIYTGSLRIAANDEPVVVDDDHIQGISTDTITVTYNDADIGGGMPFVVTKTATLDCGGPVISVDPQEPSVSAGSPPPDLMDGVSATDEAEGDLTARVVVGGDTVDTATLGTYKVTYDVSDSLGNASVQQSRIYHVIDDRPLIITEEPNIVALPFGSPAPDLLRGVTALDSVDGDLTGNISVGGEPVDISTPGTYTVTYDVTDSAGNPAIQRSRTYSIRASETPGLPFSEAFSSNRNIDESKSTAGLSTEEQRVRLAWANKGYVAMENASIIDVSSDEDDTQDIAVGDMDGNGHLDIVAGNNGVIKVYLNTGLEESPFADAVGVSVSDDKDYTESIALGDVNGDGNLDIVAGNHKPDAPPGNRGLPNRLYLNNGSENPFANVTGLNITDDDDETRSIALGDMDGDGDLDVVTGNWNQPNRVYLNNGNEDPFANATVLNITDDGDNTESIALGDMDGDGDLDVVAGNSRINRLYLNNGAENPFTGHNITDDPNITHAVAVGDVDGDGNLDVVFGNFDQLNRLYLNNGSENPFANVTGLNITADDHSTRAIALGDMNGDGRLDVVVGNRNEPSRLYLNNGSENPFANVDGTNIGDDVNLSRAIALGDIDGDGDLDVSIARRRANRLYLNNSSGNPFVNIAERLNITNDEDDTHAIAIGDIDGDGDLDVVAGNSEDEGAPNRLYLNNGTSDPFANVMGSNITDDAHNTESIALGDMDGDGDLDVVAGNSEQEDKDGKIIPQPNRLYLNNGTENPFANVTGFTISDDLHNTKSIALGDVNGDGLLDVIAGNSFHTTKGEDGIERMILEANRLYLNNGTADPFANVTGSNITNDLDNTESIALGDVNGDELLDVVAGNSILRTIDEGGNEEIKAMANRLYLNNGTGDPFAKVSGRNITDDRDTTLSIALGDVDGDGDLDVVAGIRVQPNRLYLNNGTGDPFAKVSGRNITEDVDRTFSIALDDMDGDGDLDVVAGNRDQPDRLYLNNGGENPFVNVKGFDITEEENRVLSIALGDMDGDGDLDVVAGNGRNQPNRLYLNNSTANPFANVTGVPMTDDKNDARSIALGDVNGDELLDVVTGNWEQPGRVYLNNGTANPFVNVIGHPIITGDGKDATRSIALGDVDGDGLLDVVIANEHQPNRLYLNNGTANPFANVPGLNITDDAGATRSIALGDVDGDGDLDVIAGNSVPETEEEKGTPNRVYLNNGTADPFANVTGINITDDNDQTFSITLGDVDNDGDLDVVAGNSGDRGAVNRLYLNNGTPDPFASIDGIDITKDRDSTLSVVLKDIDDDKDLDIVAGNFRQPNRLYMNNGTADPFADVKGLNITEDVDLTLSIALEDVNGDGNIDVVAGNVGANRVYFNNGSDDPFTNGTGATVAPFTDHTTGIAVKDVKGDKEMALITANRRGPNYVYFLYSNFVKPIEGRFHQTHTGTVVSRTIDDRHEPVFSATLAALADMPEHTGIDYYLSNNGGQNWYQVQSGEPLVFPTFTSGSDLRWKAELFSLSPAVTPVLHAITVTGNSAPTDIILSQSFIEENQEVGAAIGTFEATDIDGDTPVYSLVDGAGSDDNAAFTIEGNMLKANAVFDFETKPSYTIRVQAKDEAGGSFEKQFTIGISDVNDPPTDIFLSLNTIKENLPPESPIGTLTVDDIDLEDFHFFNLPEGMADNELFTIKNNSLLTNETFDYEAKNSFAVVVQVTDGGGEIIERNFDIAVEDVVDSVEVKLQLSETTFTFGKKLTVNANISSNISGSLNANTIFQFSGPNDFKEDLSLFSSEAGVASVDYVPQLAGEWQLLVKWEGNNDFNREQSKLSMFTVEKSDTNLELFFLEVPQILGKDRTIPGRLVLNNGNPGNINLSGIEIPASIGNDEKDQIFTATTDEKGNFDLMIPGEFFENKEEIWNVRASFDGNKNLKSPESFEGEILVRRSPGYAILVQGSIENGEGIDEHRNTLNFVQKSFEAAGIRNSNEDLDQDMMEVITPDTPDPEKALQEAIEIWAKEKMLAAPAPLYLVLINHGEFGKFHMHPDDLTPGELDGMLNRLQEELAEVEGSLASEQTIISVLGMCFSGSFIDEISGNNRIILSAAAPDEFSIRGTGQDKERQGELFVYTLFRELNKGLSLADSFRNSRELVRRLSEDRTLAINVNPVEPSFPREKGQHPLLDDNGDMEGSSFVSKTSGDGVLASTVFLTQPTNSIPGPQIDRKVPTVFLTADEDIPKKDEDNPKNMLWAEIDQDPDDIIRIWMEVKKVADDPGIQDETSTMQHILDFFVEPMDFYDNDGFVGYEWPRDITNFNPQGLFEDPGAYQVFFYAESDDERAELSDPVEVFVYRASGDHTPSDFSLDLPEDKTKVDYNPEIEASSGVFTWEASQSTGGDIKYIYRLWEDEGRTTLVLESEPLITSHFFLSPELIEDGTTYWWDVVAVDSQGNSKKSKDVFQFTVDNLNFPSVWTIVTLVDKTSGEPITNGQVTIPERNNEKMLGSFGIFGKYLSAATYNFTGSAPDYQAVTITRPVSGTLINLVIELELNQPEAEASQVVGIDLNPGWNLISVPVMLEGSSPETLFAGLSDNTEFTSKFDGRVLRWDGARFHEAEELVPGFGYWVKSPVKEFIETIGTSPDPLTHSYEEGWQLVGVKGTKVLQLNEDLDINGDIWGWDSVRQRFYSIKDNPFNPELNNQLIPGHGYWIDFASPGPVELGQE